MIPPGPGAPAPAARLLTPAEAAAAFGVHTKTLTRWSKRPGGPRFIRTLGGHRRYIAADVEALTTHHREEQP